jgi:8-oxo-dGTP pyrophosphatase MutT (NUDIX family)
MGPHRAQLTDRLATAAARRPWARRLAHTAARRWAGRHWVAAVAVILRGDEVLLARHRFRGDTWSLPGGWARRREDPARACEREVREELGITVRAVSPVAVELHAVDGRAVAYGGLSIAYLCVTDETGLPAARSVEISDVRWVPIAATGRYVHGFQIDALAAAADRRLSGASTTTPP